MRIASFIASITLGALLTGCATPIPLNTLKYEAKSTVTSTKEANVTIVSGAVRGAGGTWLMPAGGIFIPMSSGPNPKLQFHAEDQQAFAESLRTELVRLGILRSASADASAVKDLKVQIIFAQTFHNPNFQQYTLDVAMEITGGKEPLLKQYRVISSERDSTWDKWNTNAYEGKVKAAKLLMEKVIPDIEQYVSAL